MVKDLSLRKTKILFSDSSTTQKVPSIQWFDGAGNEVQAGGRYLLSQYNRVLEITGLLETDQQRYKCTASNSLGTVEEFLQLNVTCELYLHSNFLVIITSVLFSTF
jgi:hypothetical protein